LANWVSLASLLASLYKAADALFGGGLLGLCDQGVGVVILVFAQQIRQNEEQGYTQGAKDPITQQRQVPHCGIEACTIQGLGKPRQFWAFHS
jgi:hypothetical protein